MKTLFIILLVLSPVYSFSQTARLQGVIYIEDELPSPDVNIKLLQEGKIIAETKSNTDGLFLIPELMPGDYEVRLNYSAYKEKIFTITIKDTSFNTFYAMYPPPCIKAKRRCPHNHSDNVIPIEYGLLTSKVEKKVKNGKIKFGGFVHRCEWWHCKTHNLDF